ncbi:MAG: MotA/TolQ/ExbB proton channel family protein [Abitibacteriaceae bacterium]|nr:MotA/TolQ/ExbB proton channel family protein [Abditibacteriaceae bacterium]
MWPLFALAIISVAVMIERFIALRRAAGDNEEFLEEIRRLLTQGKVNDALALCERTSGPVASLIASGIRNRHLDNASIERAMEELAMRETPILYKRLGVLDTVITMAPLMGLLGTITGMIKSFHVVGNSMSNPSAITGGVGEALIATATGLTIAIVTLPGYNYLTERVKEIIAEMEVRATQLLNILANLRAAEANPNGVSPTEMDIPKLNRAEGKRVEERAA